MREKTSTVGCVDSGPSTPLRAVPLPVSGRNSSFARAYSAFTALCLNIHRNRGRCLRRGEGANEAGCGKEDGAERCGDGVAKAGGVVAVHFRSPNRSGYATTV